MRHNHGMDKGWHQLPHPILIGGGGATSQNRHNALVGKTSVPVNTRRNDMHGILLWFGITTACRLIQVSWGTSMKIFSSGTIGPKLEEANSSNES